jgi:hypothetical protein
MRRRPVLIVAAVLLAAFLFLSFFRCDDTADEQRAAAISHASLSAWSGNR